MMLHRHSTLHCSPLTWDESQGEEMDEALGDELSGLLALCSVNLVTARQYDFNSMFLFDTKPTHYSHAFFV